MKRFLGIIFISGLLATAIGGCAKYGCPSLDDEQKLKNPKKFQSDKGLFDKKKKRKKRN